MIIINGESDIPLYLQVYNQIKEQITTGQILVGEKLPSTRKLSTTLNVSRNTVENAYQQLCSEGYIESKAGSGFISLKLDFIDNPKPVSKVLKNIEKVKEVVHKEGYGNNYKYNFSYGGLSSSDFPQGLWRKISNKCISSIDAESFTSYKATKGEPDLQIELMKYLTQSRGVSCIPEQIIITSGMEYCLSLLCQLLRGDFQKIALEDPGYLGAKNIVINNGYEVIPIGLDKDGINIEELESSSAKIVYVTPSHQFPTGSVMSIQKRLKLLDWAIRKEGIIIEDDYDSEFRYNSRPIPSLQGIDSKGCVVYIGTFSKSLSPSLRLNYMILPPALLEKYDKLFNRYQCSVPFIEQKVVQQFMHLGHWDRHLRRICLTSKRKHDILIQTIHEQMGSKVIVHGKGAGLHILLEFNNGLSEEQLIERAKNCGVIVSPVSVFWMKPDKYSNNMILLGFGKMSENEIVEGITALKNAF
ncbi:PLP-dependent aminotransferase family protein [Clostridium sp. CS001]|uniref:MocR-like pyridoxine biosynthesis transcription factor PdxR n=1 Tax=Clostridium sp. CS001 TaxID=2880648 RepID=UPI001CF28791|nr:PLP-dependent aminotransferase family protein [Clostridium sp. CS001]MCB2288586.1 PLP-dependent aminotransferase family protein [Clostridium sp. CS001]